jgi:hypothetical protein
MPDNKFRAVGSDVFIRLLEDPDKDDDPYEQSDWGGSEIVSAIVVDVGDEAASGIKKGATCMVYGYVRDNARLPDGSIVASSWSVAAVVGG